LKGFKDFILRGNLLEMAVAFIMGAAFNDVVKSFTSVVMSVISKIIGNQPNFDSVTILGVAVGPFITSAISFVILATVVYFLIVKPMNAIKAKFTKPVPETPADTELSVLTDIRDLLKKD
jgi:large conductance mechanosensitive channel